MPLLIHLSVNSWYASSSICISSLSFLRAGRLSLTLQVLRLLAAENHALHLPFAELAHVESLHALRSLTLDGMFHSPLRKADEQLVEDHWEHETWPMCTRMQVENLCHTID